MCASVQTSVRINSTREMCAVRGIVCSPPAQKLWHKEKKRDGFAPFSFEKMGAFVLWCAGPEAYSWKIGILNYCSVHWELDDDCHWSSAHDWWFLTVRIPPFATVECACADAVVAAAAVVAGVGCRGIGGSNTSQFLSLLLPNQRVRCVRQYHEHQVHNFSSRHKCFTTVVFSVAFVKWIRWIFASSSRLRMSSSFNPYSVILVRHCSCMLYSSKMVLKPFLWQLSNRPWLFHDLVLLWFYHTCFHTIYQSLLDFEGSRRQAIEVPDWRS